MSYLIPAKFIILLLLSVKTFASTLTLQVKQPNHSIALRTHKEILVFRPNASLHWGVKFSGDFIYLEYGGKIKDTNYSKSNVGNNSYKSYRIGVPIANTYTDFYYQEWTGFSSDENSGSVCEYCLERVNLSSRDRGFHFLYATNSEFSMKALNSDGSQGVKWSASPILTVFGNRTKYRDPDGLLQGDSNEKLPFFAELTSLEMSQLGLGVGYGLLAPFSSFYIGLAGIIGGAYQSSERMTIDGDVRHSHSLGTHWSVKVMAATHGKGINFGAKGSFFVNIYNLVEDNSAASINYSLYLYSSYTW